MKYNDRAYSDADLLVIGPEGEQLGVLKLGPACQKAKDAGLDLVMVAEGSNPPVCRIMDFGKLCYEQKKKLKDQKKHNQAQKVKEIKFRLNIDTHDYEFKIAHGVEFLQEGSKLKVTIMFKGREMAHTERGVALMERFADSVSELGVIEKPAKLDGRNMIMILTPKKAAPKKEKQDKNDNSNTKG